MKHIKFKWALPLLCSASLIATSGCSVSDPLEQFEWNTTNIGGISLDTVIIDSLGIPPLVISVSVLSPQGYSILPYTNLSTVYAEFRGKKYYCGVKPDTQENRLIIPNFYGLKAQQDFLLFGELDGTELFYNEKLIIQWGNEAIKPDTIVFSNFFTDDGTIDSDFWINGFHISKYVYANAHSEFDAIYRTTEEAAGRGILALRKDLTVLNHPNLKETNPIPLEEGYALNNDVFQFALLHQALKSNPDKSLITSPLGVAYLLAMIGSGTGEASSTALELLLALKGAGYCGIPIPSYCIDSLNFRETPENRLLETVIQYAQKCDPDVEIDIASALFARKDFTLYSGYVNYIAEAYHADYALLDFSTPLALQAINNWSNQKTRGTIPQILNEIDPLAAAYALNAIHFQAPWMQPFNKERTRTETFTRADGTTVQVPMMQLVDSFKYFEDDNQQIVCLPFANGAFNMIVVLPKMGKTFDQLLNSSTLPTLIYTMRQTNQLTTVALSLPRFAIETTNKNLKEQLQQLGVRRLFSSELANLTEISPEQLYISNILQKASIKVDENGCEAAAASIVDPAVPSVELLDNISIFRANRPFLYFITERSSGLIFFAGAYCGD